MTEYFEHEKWLIVGNANNWGRDTSFKTALAAAIKSAGMSSPMTQAHVYRIEANRELKPEDLWCDDFGQCHYATDAKFTKLARWDVPKKLTDAYFAFDLAAEEAEYGGAIDKAFNE